MSSPTASPSGSSLVDGRSALAMSMHALPGVYAVLVGSGMSTAAGIPTGWQVVQDLIRRVAVSEGVDPDILVDAPEEWWAAQGRPEPRYDTLLAALASTETARQQLLRRYFDPLPPDGPIEPTAAHVALASLCAQGRVRLVLTTNFDRLIERALDAVGITPQVIANADVIKGMTPLAHAPVTVVKLHGDYAMPGLRNTPEELSAYPAELDSLLDRVFDEWGLLAIGWSATYDVALANAMARAPSRRYPTFLTSHGGSMTEEARQLVALRQGSVIDTRGADEFLADLVERLRRLDEIAARRTRPQIQRTYFYAPDMNAPQGWKVLPLLMLRAVCSLGPATLDTMGLIEPQHREAMVQALRVAPVTAQIYALAGGHAVSAEADTAGSPADVQSLADWHPTPDAQQSTEMASYRLGGDAAAGVSAIASMVGPRYGVGGAVVFKLDVAVSIDRKLYLGEVARLLRDGLVFVTGAMPAAFNDMLPPEADVQHAEIHLLGAAIDGQSKNRPNDIDRRIELSSLGKGTRDIGQQAGYAASINGPLTEHDAAAVVAEGIRYLALSFGYLDPRTGIASLRAELGLPAG